MKNSTKSKAAAATRKSATPLKAGAAGKRGPGGSRPLKPKGERSGWRRAAADHTVTHDLGVRIRSIREEKGLSLAQLSAKCDVPDATLSRIENNKMSPTFGLLARVMMGLEVDWIDLVGPRRLEPGQPLASFAEPNSGTTSDVRGSTALVLHSHDTARNLPLLLHVRARELSDVGGLIGHRGEEFCYVLEGKLVLHMEAQPPRILKPGASALFDSTIPHAYLAGGSEGVKFLVVVNREFGFVPKSDGAPTT